MTLSAQIDRFVHDRLPASDALPALLFDAPELQFPAQVNLVEELLDKAVLKGHGARPLLRSATATLTYADCSQQVDRLAQVLVQEVVMPTLAAHYDELLDIQARGFATVLGTDDLQAIAAFYATPLGRKLLGAIPEVTAEALRFGQAWGARVAGEAIAKHRAALRARGFNL